MLPHVDRAAFDLEQAPVSARVRRGDGGEGDEPKAAALRRATADVNAAAAAGQGGVKGGSVSVRRHSVPPGLCPLARLLPLGPATPPCER